VAGSGKSVLTLVPGKCCRNSGASYFVRPLEIFMTPLHSAFLFIGLAAATAGFAVAYFYVVPFMLEQLGHFFCWFNTGWDNLTNRRMGFFVAASGIFWLCGFCLLCASITWLRIIDGRLFEVGIGCLIVGTSLFIKAS